jgi:cobalamin biosynthesis protein CbiD
MTTTQALQHPNTEKITTLAIGAALGLAAQHGIDLKEQVATLSQFLSSSEVHTAIIAALVIFAKVKDGLTQPGAVAEFRSSAAPDFDAIIKQAIAGYVAAANTPPVTIAGSVGIGKGVCELQAGAALKA